MKLFIALLVGASLYFIQLFLYKRYWDRGLTVDIGFTEPVVREGDEDRLIEVIYNDKALPLPVVQIKFEITRTFLFANRRNSAVTDRYYRNDHYSILPHQKITRTYSFKCTKRGYYRMNGMDVICKDLFLSGMMLKSLTHEAAVCVLPGRLEGLAYEPKVRMLIGRITDRIRQNEDPFEFSGIREYQSYDPMNRINWKSSASKGMLMVNKFDSSFSMKVTLCLNMECHIRWHEEEFMEEQIRIASTLAHEFIDRNIPVSLVSNGEDSVTKAPVFVEAGADKGHLRNMDIMLARIDAKNPGRDFVPMLEETVRNDRTRNTEYIIISNYRKKDLVEAYNGMKNRGLGVSWIIAEYQSADPLIMNTGDEDITKWTVRHV
ncbi:MAG: DUF58 domain-containing protein [Lachnospiraceae bacterium]|nr:DUF58 domain-containing protein [Lachnospiraceae bacterium]